MSKNTLSTAYRKVNVDAFNEDQFVEDVGEDDGISGPNESEVSSLLLAKRCKDALVLVLNDAPVASKSSQLKDKALQLVIRVLLSFKTSEIESTVKSLTPQQIDTLMKYVYAGFENPTDESSKLLLTWHEKTFEVGGLGSIVRVMTDRKKVA